MKNQIAADIIVYGIILGGFLFCIDDSVLCVLIRIASFLEKLKKISLLCLLSWRYDKNSIARPTPVSNIFSWFQRCSSHLSSAVLLHIF